LRVIGYDRAGYGGSTAKPGREVADIANDIEDVMNELGVERFASLGGSGGGPHTLALGALLADRCVATASIASPTPWEAEEIDQLAGMGEQNIEEFNAALAGPAELEPLLEREAASLRAASPEELKDVLSTLLPPVDREVWTGDRAAHAKLNIDRALEPGIAGWRDDDLAFTRDWGFSLAPAINGETPLRAAIWQGDQDRMVPFAHGQWLAAAIPGARVHLMPGDGHLSMTVSAFDQILDDLLDLAGLERH
jgi:pimeloyl-ACP methyl ester carboxylesterase